MSFRNKRSFSNSSTLLVPSTTDFRDFLGASFPENTAFARNSKNLRASKPDSKPFDVTDFDAAFRDALLQDNFPKTENSLSNKNSETARTELFYKPDPDIDIVEFKNELSDIEEEK